MTILQRLIYSTGASDGGGRGANRSFERNKHHSTDFCFYTSTHFDGSPTSTILATSSRNTNNASHYQVQKLLASRELDGPLCIHRKGFFDHLKPRAFATSVRPFVVCGSHSRLVMRCSYSMWKDCFLI